MHWEIAMQLPALKNSVPASLGNQSLEDFVRNSTQALQQMAATLPGSGIAGGVVYLGFNGNTGEYKLSKEVIEPKSLGRILVPQHGLFEAMIEWANGQALQKVAPRQLLGIKYDEPISEAMFKKPLSPHLYRKDTDGPTHMFGFVGFMLDDGANVMFEHGSGGAKKALNALATTAVQAVVTFGEAVHPVIECSVSSYPSGGRTIYNPVFTTIGFVTDKRALEADAITDSDIITRPTTSKAKTRRGSTERPAI
jgi:hypothetical protein